jgi:hypothetical protein
VKRVSPTEHIRAEIDELFSSERDLAEVLEEVGRLATRLLMQTAVEAEVTEFLGRDRYERGRRAREALETGMPRRPSRPQPGRYSLTAPSSEAPTRRSRPGCSARA